METFNVSISQSNGENTTFNATANGIGANDYNDLAKSIASFAKKTNDLNTLLVNAKVKGISRQRIKKSHSATFAIYSNVDEVTLSFEIANFGQFLDLNDTDKVTEIVSAIINYQVEIGYLFSISK